MFLGIGEIAADWEWPRFGRRQVAVLLFLLACDPWRVHPEYIAYFNELAGGVDGGRAHLLDSNLDWDFLNIFEKRLIQRHVIM